MFMSYFFHVNFEHDQAISAGGLAVLKIIATMDHEELREATVRVIITLLGKWETIVGDVIW